MRPVVAHSISAYCPAAWIYHQLTFLREFEAIVLARRKERLDQFPFEPIYAHADLSWPRRLLERLARGGLGHGFPQHRQAAARHHASLLHSHFCSTAMRDWPLARALGVPHLATFYGADIWAHSRRPGWLERFERLAAACDRFLVEGNAMRRKVLELGAPAERVRVWHLGVDLEQIPFRPRRPEPGGRIRILMAGRAYEKKGYVYGLRAFARLAAHEPLLQLDMIVGGATEEAARTMRELRETIAELGLGPRVTWSEFLPYADYLRRVDEAHIFLQPSVVAKDGDAEGGFPVTLAEMSAAGVPIVATRHCDIPEAVLDGRTGFLADERDVEGLARQLERVVRRPETWDELGRAGREHIERSYNMRRQIEELEGHYRELIG